MLFKTIESEHIEPNDIQFLGEALNEETHLLGQALDLGLNQRQALIGNNLKELQAISEKQNQLAVEFEKIEETRQTIFFKVARTRGKRGGKEAAGVTCDELYPFMDPASAEWIEGLRSELKTKLESLKKLNDVNAVLIKNSRNITRNTIEIITGLAEGPRKKKNQLYGSEGKINSIQKPKRNLFNRKA